MYAGVVVCMCTRADDGGLCVQVRLGWCKGWEVLCVQGMAER